MSDQQTDLKKSSYGMWVIPVFLWLFFFVIFHNYYDRGIAPSYQEGPIKPVSVVINSMTELEQQEVKGIARLASDAFERMFKVEIVDASLPITDYFPDISVGQYYLFSTSMHHLRNTPLDPNVQHLVLDKSTTVHEYRMFFDDINKSLSENDA